MDQHDHGIEALWVAWGLLAWGLRTGHEQLVVFFFAETWNSNKATGRAISFSKRYAES